MGECHHDIRWHSLFGSIPKPWHTRTVSVVGAPRVAILGFYVGVAAFLEIDARVAGFPVSRVRVALLPWDRRSRGKVPWDRRSRGRIPPDRRSRGHADVSSAESTFPWPRRRQSGGKNPRQRQSGGTRATVTKEWRSVPHAGAKAALNTVRSWRRAGRVDSGERPAGPNGWPPLRSERSNGCHDVE